MYILILRFVSTVYFFWQHSKELLLTIELLIQLRARNDPKRFDPIRSENIFVSIRSKGSKRKTIASQFLQFKSVSWFPTNDYFTYATTHNRIHSKPRNSTDRVTVNLVRWWWKSRFWQFWHCHHLNADVMSFKGNVKTNTCKLNLV